MFTVFYRGSKNYNPYRTYPKNADRYVRSQSFKNEDEARAFANEKTIEGFETKIYNPIGKRVA